MPTGSFQHNIDSKNRLFIPAKLRSSLGDRFVVAKSLDKQPCLCIYTLEEWSELDERIKRLSLAKSSKLLRHKYDESSEVECDPQGRITLTQAQRDFAKLENTAYITGVAGHVEIWNRPGLGLEGEDDEDFFELFAEVE